MDDVTYEIVDWNIHFEKAQTRKCVDMKWVPVPTRQDGAGYRRVSAHKDATEIFAAWILILEIAAKMPIRGLLEKDGRPLTAEDMAIASGYPQGIFEKALKVLSQKNIGWISNGTGS